jgi:hypothetical protein
LYIAKRTQPNIKEASMSATAAPEFKDFSWSTQPKAAHWLDEVSQQLRAHLPMARTIKQRLLDEAGVRFDDLIDTVQIGDDEQRISDALAAGWVRGADDRGWEMYSHPGGIFPQIAVDRRLPAGRVAIDLKVESVAEFVSAWNLQTEIVGEAGMRWRWACVEQTRDAVPDVVLGVTERLAWRGLWKDDDKIDPKVISNLLGQFINRRREFEDDADGFEHTRSLIEHAIQVTDRDVACQLFFTAEREYWMSRNKAARAQFARQQRLGIGFANHDHHTYRSSRQYFAQLIGLWELLGLVCRERFYAGREAGWGAQVMEQPVTGIVTFNDVDLSADELLGDFAHEPLAPSDSLGTVGLWCALHGEAVLQAGMHHLEAQFAFDALRDQLASTEGIGMTRPFTDFPHLRQAFTEGERWAVSEKRIGRLLDERLITLEQAAKFRTQGAIGSHLENLERNDGFKGFNQTGVSQIISATDPRKHLATT